MLKEKQLIASSIKTKSSRTWAYFPWASKSLEQSWTDCPLISVVLPVYNQSEYLKDSIQSVLTQDYQELELIVVDDGSTDSFESAVEPFLKDSRLIVIRQPNGGIAQALNRGFEKARGVFLTWTSADNNYLPGALSSLSKFLTANPSVSLAYANVQLINDRGEVVVESNYRKSNQSQLDPSVLELPTQADSLWNFSDNFINACFLYRRNAQSIIGPYQSALKGFEDYDYWLKCALVGEIAHIDSEKPYYQYRLHDNSLTANLKKDSLESKTVAHAKALAPIIRNFNSYLRYQVSTHPSEESLGTYLLSVLKKGPCEVQIDTKKNEKSAQTHCTIDAHIDALGSAAKEQISIRLLHDLTLCDSLLHSTHSALFDNSHSTPIEIFSKEKKVVALPPLNTPIVLKRARDSNFQAVTPSKDTIHTCLIFVPDKISWKSPFAEPSQRAKYKAYRWWLQSVETLTHCMNDIHWVFLTENHEQEKSLKDIRKGLLSKTNVSTIMLSETDKNSKVCEAHNANLESLLYVLSSVDSIISLKSPSLSYENFSEIRIEAMLAALSGLPLLSLSESKVKGGRTKHFECQKNRELFNRLGTELIDMPHVSYLSLPFSGKTINNELELFRHTLASIAQFPPSIGSLEQWIEKQSMFGIEKNIRSVVFSAHATATVQADSTGNESF